jgi:hypothetical protein
VIGLRLRAALKLDLARDDAHPRGHTGGAARAYSRPLQGGAPPRQLCAPRNATLAGRRRRNVVANA